MSLDDVHLLRFGGAKCATFVLLDHRAGATMTLGLERGGVTHTVKIVVRQAERSVAAALPVDDCLRTARLELAA